MQTIKISFPYTLKYALAANRSIRGWRYLATVIVVSLIVAVALCINLSHDPSPLKLVCCFIGAVIGYIVFVEVMVILRVRGLYKSSPLRNAMLEWEISEDEIRQKTPNGASQLSWNAFYKIREKRRGFALYLNKGFGYWLPAIAFASPEERQAFAEMARAKSRDFKGSGGNF